MAYTPILSVADVQQHYPGVKFDEDSRPTLRQVRVWCTEATALIYSAIATNYVVPITNDNDITVLKAIARYYVLPHVDRILAKTTIEKVKKGNSEESYAETFSRMLQEISDGTLLLIGSTREQTYYQFYSYNQANEITPVSKKVEDIW